MLKTCVLAALLASTAAANAANSFSFAIDGANVRISIPNNCADISCLSISTSQHNHVAPRSDDADDEDNAQPTPDTVPAQPKAAPEPPAPKAADIQPAAPTGPVPAPKDAPSPAAPAKVAGPETKPLPAPAPVLPAPKPTPVIEGRAEPAQPSPIGVWLTEKKEGEVHIVPCGSNLCGYVYDAKAQHDGKQVLIDMRPTETAEWSGRIRDVRGYGGGTYDSTMTIKGTDKLRIRGCAFGGMICGGQTWSRV